ncbi:MAG TPA: hypothetical protein VFC51_16335 [Chloroflexota bacterium]|nr:hypothetical protein [Chloroflexota bacterium]
MNSNPAIVTVPLITGFIEALKRAGIVQPRYAALASLAVGTAASIGAYLTTGTGAQGLYDAILQGAAVGLAASGLYSVANAAAGRSSPR